MNLGSFSVSLSVKNVQASQAFYEMLGFSVVDGRSEDNWLILQNGEARVGIFQDKFEGNLLAFNPPDVREIQQVLKAHSVELLREAEGQSGPASVVLRDPDGNVILIDQLT